MTRKHFVTTDWLAEHLASPDVVVVDASWYLPGSNRDGREEYLEAHVPGAVYFDIDDVKDPDSPLPHMLPDPIVFSAKMRKLGIGDGQRIIVYDGDGFFSAPRVWWTFRLMGVEDVTILEGGFARWTAEERPVEAGPVERRERHFTARFDHGGVRDTEEVARALQTDSAQVVDNRPTARFTGEAEEPRAGIPSGHMPGAINLPGPDLLTPDGSLKDDQALRETFAAAGVDLSRPIITSCGSGVTASATNFALEVLGYHNHALYDGSWTEWAQSGKPIVKGRD